MGCWAPLAMWAREPPSGALGAELEIRPLGLDWARVDQRGRLPRVLVPLWRLLWAALPLGLMIWLLLTLPSAPIQGSCAGSG